MSNPDLRLRPRDARRLEAAVPRRRGSGTSVKYILLIETDSTGWQQLTEAERNSVFAGHGAFREAVLNSGEMLDGATLTDPWHSAVVRVRDESLRIAEGPLTESERHFTGYYIVDVETRERALELASMIPEARFGAIEVRPIMSRGGAEM
jgi:hypothetical protein